MKRRFATVALALALGPAFLAACGSPSPVPPGPARPTSVVVMGDSVASGEGTLYGYHYDPASQRWVGGNLNVTWPGPYPLCHTSPDAYGDVVAARFHSHLAQFACTGSTFTGGIAGPKFDGVTEARPAQFGNWASRQGLNAAYDRAKPDLVLISLGADDVRFTSVVKACVENHLEHSVLPIALQCTPSDPGATFQRDFTAVLPSVLHNERTLVDWIDQRGRADHRVPRIVFTTYYDPFPANGKSCPDSELLSSAQIDFLTQALARFDASLVQTITGLHRADVKVVDLFHAFDGHRWCSVQPWAYGLSIFRLTDPASLSSQAPFHPTPAGQQAIAARLDPVVTRLFTVPVPQG